MNLDIDGVNCRYEQYGEGKDILLLHGWGGSVDSWIPVTNFFATKGKVTVLDFPGHGESGFPAEDGWTVGQYADWTKKVIDRLGIAGCDVVAHSFGGRVTLKLASTYPALFDKLLLTGCAGLAPKHSKGFEAKTKMVKGVKGMLSHLPGGEKLTEALQGVMGSEDYKALSPAMRETFKKVVEEDLHDCLPKIGNETLLIWGREDTATPLWMGQTMEQEIKGSALIVFDYATHFAYLERNAEFLRIADAFFFPPKGN